MLKAFLCAHRYALQPRQVLSGLEKRACGPWMMVAFGLLIEPNSKKYWPGGRNPVDGEGTVAWFKACLASYRRHSGQGWLRAWCRVICKDGARGLILLIIQRYRGFGEAARFRLDGFARAFRTTTVVFLRGLFCIAH